jgi:hypothetical protein
VVGRLGVSIEPGERHADGGKQRDRQGSKQRCWRKPALHAAIVA